MIKGLFVLILIHCKKSKRDCRNFNWLSAVVQSDWPDKRI